ncbi:glutathione-disulfide reductase [Sphingobium indicum]|uniref:Glutathione reductase n=2 Tax=Sphingobium indicum TaxID=332055 RepID=A0A1L5BMJ2_SPHIB|nr:glutathione-disulfide reductase [Sphingobium indicum]APL94058.1 glutathione reductase [Sphingobium indicum B90A]KEY99354.1 glutathione reductase [Sphingomonas sp. BHC-A]NYI21358.1 glutathione reductase (NADPH) [Sphingobium indicum]RYM03846.1 glutathione-disulfide reductase [Sphingobium indicum]
MSDYDFDLFVIGAGSGGVRASRVAAAHGAKVAVAEEYRVGGTCVIRGCVPKKLLIYGAHFAEDLKDARRFGWNVPDCDFEWKTLRDNVLADVDRLEGLYRNTLDNHEVELIQERATITGPHGVRLASGREVSAKYILVSTGAWPIVPDIEGAEHGVTSNELFHLEECPKRIVIVGGGYIANEFAGIFHQFGSHVTIVNRSGTLLRGYDEQIRDRLLQISTMKGINFRFNAEMEKIEKKEDGTLTVRFKSGDPIACDLLLFATGRRPHVEGLGLENAGVELSDKGAIKVDDYSRTSCESIYAVGDVTDRMQLTPMAIREGHAFADTLFGDNPRTVDYACVPSAVFSHPPLAGVGMTEAEARNKLGTVKIYTSDFRPMKNVLAGRDERALYKMVVDATTDRVVGLHMIGPDAPEILQAAAIAVKAGLTKQAFDDTVALHPSMAEELVLLK